MQVERPKDYVQVPLRPLPQAKVMSLPALRYLIQKDEAKAEWLDGYGGGIDWEWTTDRRTAWRLRKEEGERKLLIIRKHFPNAVLVEA